jgi:hypothetical protein
MTVLSELLLNFSFKLPSSSLFIKGAAVLGTHSSNSIFFNLGSFINRHYLKYLYHNFQQQLDIMSFRKNSAKRDGATDTPIEKFGPSPSETPATSTPERLSDASAVIRGEQIVAATSPTPLQKVTLLTVNLGSIASIGGFMFGYESGQISGTHSSTFRISEHTKIYVQVFSRCRIS